MAETRWLDETEERAWRGFLRMSWLLDAAIGRDLARDSGLSHADYAVLVPLSEAPGQRLRMNDLARGILWSKSRLSHQIGRMEARGLVTREGCAGDARGTFAVLTPDGLRAIQDAAPGHVESIRRHLISRLAREQVEALAGITGTVVEHLHAEAMRDPECQAHAEAISDAECQAEPCD